MKHINKTRQLAAAIDLDGGSMFAGRPGRMARAIPRRDPDGHPQSPEAGKADGDEGAKGDPKGDPKNDKDDPTPVDVTKSKEFRAEKKRADDALAELQALREKGMSEDEKTRESETKARVEKAVADKETELTDHYEGRIAALQGQILESTIDGVFATSSLERKDFDDVIATLDKTQFIKDDGSVDREKVQKTLSPITKAATSRPPRSKSTRVAQDNGFGRYLTED